MNNYDFEILFNKYYQQLVYFAHKIILDKGNAEDIVVASFCKIKDRQFEIGDHAKRYLYTIIKTGCVDLLRTNKRVSKKGIDFNRYENIRENELELYAIEAEIINRVWREVELFPDRMKAVFKLKYLDGKTTDEISNALQITAGNIYYQLSMACSKLRLKLH